MVTLETPASDFAFTWPNPSGSASECFVEESPAAEPTCTESQAGSLATFKSRAGLAIEVVEFCNNRFDALVEMYNNFEPKRAAQGLPPVGHERIVAWLRHLQKNGHNLLALWNGQVIGHSMLCAVDPQRAEFAIFLHQNFRNQGIGTELTEVTLKLARLKNLRTIWLSVEVSNGCAIRVYRKKGFQVSGMFGPEQEMTLDLEQTVGNEVGIHEPAA
jgi:RimJ/RimL family protein N-acetyltransferase